MSCVVVDQLLPGSLLSGTIAGLVSADLDAASQVATAAGVSVLALQAALAEPDIGSAGSGDRARTLAAVILTSEAVAAGLQQQSAAVAAPFAVEGDPAGFGSTYTSLVASAGSLAALATARSYVGRIGTNIMLSGS